MANIHKKITPLICSIASIYSYSLFAQVIEEEEVLVRGIRASLDKAFDQKRAANNLSEVILAEDIGKFPDTNIAESLQRITGVAIERNGGEGQFLTVRGFGPEFNMVLMNGRTLPTDNQGREFSFDVVAAELVGGVQLHKSPLANIQEGAIGATVNIQTRRPLDFEDQFVALGSAKGIYEQLAEEITPTVSGLFSVKNDESSLGASLAFNWTSRESVRDELRVGGWNFNPINVLHLSDEPGEDRIEVVPDVYTPRNYFLARWQEKRERLSINGAFQWQANESLLFTVDTFFSDFHQQNEGHGFKPFYPSDNYLDYTLDEHRTVTSFTRAGRDTIDSLDQSLIDASNNGTGPSVSFGQQMDAGYGFDDRPTKTGQIGFNAEWQFSDQLLLIGDLSYGSAKNSGGGKTQRVYPGIAARTTDPAYEFRPGDDIPSVTNTGTLTDESLYNGHWGRVTGDNVKDDILEAKLDATWNLDGTLSRVRSGFSFSEREKDKKAYETPKELFICFHCGYNLPVPSGMFRHFSADGFLDGVKGEIPDAWMIFDGQEMLDYYASPTAVQWQVDNGIRTQAQADEYLANGGHTPRFVASNSANVNEDVLALYVDALWTWDVGETTWQAIAGARYVDTDVTAKGVGTEVLWVQSQAGDNTLIPNQVITPNQEFSSSYSHLLPSAVLDIDLNNGMKLKFAAAQTVTRPSITSLYPARTFTHRENGPRINSGNPELEPFESLNFDFAWEWYIGDANFLGVNLFHKEIDEWITLVTQPVDIANYAINQDPEVDDPCCNLTYQETLPMNQESAEVSGVEFAVSHVWDSGFGAQFNYTYVESNAEYANSDQSFALEGLSPNSYNIVGFYEEDKYSIRLAYNWREEFLVLLSGRQGQPENREDFGQLDMQANYEISDKISLFFEGINLLGEEINEYSLYKNRFLTLEQNGRRFGVGIRAKF